MRTEDGVRAWQILRRLPAYRYAWRRRRPPPGLTERAPFPVRLQTADDLAAARFGLLAGKTCSRSRGRSRRSGRSCR